VNFTSGPHLAHDYEDWKKYWLLWN
jgi:hypothetical protein